jgi:hypothetical protein
MDAAMHMLGSAGDQEAAARTSEAVARIWGKDDAAYYQCNNCTLEFGWPFVAATSEVYSAAYSGTVFYESWKWEYDISLDRIKSIVAGKGPNLKLIEIGAGDGAFVRRLAKDIIPASNLLTTEFSAYGRKVISDAGIPCLSVDIPELVRNISGGRYNIACMFQVLEHLDNPTGALSTIATLMEKEADLFIAVPNNYHRKLYDSVGEHFDLAPVHLTRWSRKSMELLARNSGWKVVEHLYQPQPVLGKLRFFLSNRYQVSSLKKIASRAGNKAVYTLLTSIFILLLAFRYTRQVWKLIAGATGVSQWYWLKKI